MIKHGESIVWSASDLTTAVQCEYAFLRKVDRCLGWEPPAARQKDPLQERLATIGLEHEARILGDLEDEFGSSASLGGVVRLSMASGSDVDALTAAADATKRALASGAGVVYQAGFFDGEFHGYADFIRSTSEGWVVADAKIARREKVTALLQIAAYADQLTAWGVPLAPTAELMLGTGETVSFPLSDIVPVFRERRDRLRALITDHVAGSTVVEWDTPGVRACGSCEDCSEAVEGHEDLLLVAGLRMSQRRRLKDEGINSVTQLAEASSRPDGISTSTFERLRAQARLQLKQMRSAATGEQRVFHEVFCGDPLRALPAPSQGDLFFDFEGDPMYREPGSGRWGLEYLWGVVRAGQSGAPGEFWPLWADSRAEERSALVAFMEEVGRVRGAHPDMHIYHYAPYEVTALKRLVSEHMIFEDELDDLLRTGVFVDLYATVRSSIRVSQPSYSIKKLEPLYLSVPRDGDVTKGDDSIAQYQYYRDLVAAGGSQEAKKLRESLLHYNRIDCVSTMELRDWLKTLTATDAGEPSSTAEAVVSRPRTAPHDEQLRVLEDSLVARSAAAQGAARTTEQQAWAMLASALGYYRREDKPFWWAHFDRLCKEPDQWSDETGTLRVDEADVAKDWCVEGAQRARRRRLTLTGTPGGGQSFEVGDNVWLMYDFPGPEGMERIAQGLRGCPQSEAAVCAVLQHVDGRVTVDVEECNKVGQADHSCLPVALVPTSGPQTAPLKRAVEALAQEALSTNALPAQPAIDILACRTPRTVSGAGLRSTGDHTKDVVAALLDLDRSYLAIQGPPGTGKTWLGSRVIARMVADHGWKVGVVAQSHAVVENMLEAITDAGLSGNSVGKTKAKSSTPAWTPLKDGSALAQFCADRSTGHVIGGTAWDFTGRYVPNGSLDLLVIDEAGQFALANTLAVSAVAPRLLLLGDPQQLPQVSQGRHGEPVDQSALSWVIGSEAVMPAERGYFLETSYRMHPAVCRAVSTLSYDNKLRSAPQTESRRLDQISPGIRVLQIDHHENSVSSEEETDEVLRQTTALLGRTWTNPDDPAAPRQLAERDILVVTPYNAQRQLITRKLADAGLQHVRVGTVDKFQGQQAPVVIVSMTASSHDDVPRGMEFLLNRNRINVAISRAQWLAVIIRSTTLTSYMPSSVDRLLELGGFIGVCDRAAPAS